jgi:hypothetical protein
MQMKREAHSAPGGFRLSWHGTPLGYSRIFPADPALRQNSMRNENSAIPSHRGSLSSCKGWITAVPYSLFPKPNARAILPAILRTCPCGAGLPSFS